MAVDHVSYRFQKIHDKLTSNPVKKINHNETEATLFRPWQR